MKCSSEYNAKPQEIIVVGDRVDREILYGKKLGFVTVRVLQGRHRNLTAENEKLKADFTIQNITAVQQLLGEADTDVGPDGHAD